MAMLQWESNCLLSISYIEKGYVRNGISLFVNRKICFFLKFIYHSITELSDFLLCNRIR